MKLFGRRWRVTVGTLSLGDGGGGADTLDVRFKIRRDTGAKPNKCELTIYNLTADHRNELARAHHAPVRVEAGYVDGTSLIFAGTTRDVSSVSDGTDWTTTIEAGDGQRRFQSGRALRSFGPDARAEDVIRGLAEALDVGIGNAREALRAAALDRVGQAFPNGTVLHSGAADQLTALTRSVGLEWSIQSGVLQLLARRGALATDAVRLTPESGLIGSPEVAASGKVTAKSLLIPDIAPGRLVRIESEHVTGTYRIEVAEYTGDSAPAATEWFAEIECRPRRES